MATAESSASDNTSTSHTLSDPSRSQVNMSSLAFVNNSANEALLKLLAPENRHSFIQPTAEIPDASIAFAKATLDSLAGQIADEQTQRLKDERKKRKRGEEKVDNGEVLKIRKVHTEGFAVEQVWQQAKRVIDALRDDAERALEELGGPEQDVIPGVKITGQVRDAGVEMMKFGKDGFEVDSDEEEDEDEEDDEEVDGEDEGMDSMDEDEDEDGADMDDMLETMEGEDDYEEEDEEEEEEKDAGVFSEDPHGLNDGFFSIDDFNKQTEFLEQADANADPNTGEASDEEDIDWDADPMSAPLSKALKATSGKSREAAMDIDEESDEDEEGGPTFGNVDLNAPMGDSDDEDEDADMDDVADAGDNTNDVLYKDFFEPPPRKAGKGEREAAYQARQEKKRAQAPVEDDATTMERAMADVRRDLFDDASDNDDSGDALSDLDPADPKSRRSAHERRQAKLAEEIRRLEAASVAKRDWTLSGEAKANDRPLNSLLEEDLDFERTGKPVPVITAEVSESIEELIKRRILAQEFDEVIRRRPDSLTPATTRRGAFELDDNKAQQSLAEMYEEEHIKATNPDTYVSKSDEKLKKEHDEIDRLWRDVCGKLDALSSWHYKPKPAAPSITVVSDVATIAMEDAQPSTAAGINGGDSMLAPQEIYKAGQEKAAIEAGEVVPKSGAPVARQEMSREEKLRRRRREKERIKKRGGLDGDKKKTGKKAREAETLSDLKRGGVKVIGKRGEVRDVDGNKVQEAAARNGAGGFKL